LMLRSVLFPASAITMFGLPCRCNSLTHDFARSNDSCQARREMLRQIVLLAAARRVAGSPLT
jgi:hypothetical protein